MVGSNVSSSGVNRSPAGRGPIFISSPSVRSRSDGECFRNLRACAREKPTVSARWANSKYLPTAVLAAESRRGKSARPAA
jgi:hypothetical protein